MSTDKCVLNKRQIYFPWDSRLPPRCTFVVRSLLIISSRDCREADSRDTSPRHACLGEVSRKIWLHDFAINNNGGSVPVIFISLSCSNYSSHFTIHYNRLCPLHCPGYIAQISSGTTRAKPIGIAPSHHATIFFKILF